MADAADLKSAEGNLVRSSNPLSGTKSVAIWQQPAYMKDGSWYDASRGGFSVDDDAPCPKRPELGAVRLASRSCRA